MYSYNCFIVNVLNCFSRFLSKLLVACLLCFVALRCHVPPNSLPTRLPRLYFSLLLLLLLLILYYLRRNNTAMLTAVARLKANLTII
jgi:hypothetical protein